MAACVIDGASVIDSSRHAMWHAVICPGRSKGVHDTGECSTAAGTASGEANFCQAGKRSFISLSSIHWDTRREPRPFADSADQTTACGAVLMLSSNCMSGTDSISKYVHVRVHELYLSNELGIVWSAAGLTTFLATR